MIGGGGQCKPSFTVRLLTTCRSPLPVIRIDSVKTVALPQPNATESLGPPV